MWRYKIRQEPGVVEIAWMNENLIYPNQPLVILLQYGHGTGTGGYVQGRDFINPAMFPVFEEIANAVWKVVKSS